MPINCFDYISGFDKIDWESLVGTDFDGINNEELCRKYIIRDTQAPQSKSKLDKAVVKKFDRLVEKQFRLHIDTENLRRNAFKLNPSDLILILFR